MRMRAVQYWHQRRLAAAWLTWVAQDAPGAGEAPHAAEGPGAPHPYSEPIASPSPACTV